MFGGKDWSPPVIFDLAVKTIVYRQGIITEWAGSVQLTCILRELVL
jgi:hypothetical protein